MNSPRMTREESRQQTRERLLESALQVFSRQGYQAASVDEIAEAAGYSKGAVYSNFSNKEELFLELLDRRFALDRATWPGMANVIAPTMPSVEEEEDGFTQSIQGDRAWVILLMEFFLYALRDEKAWKVLQPRIHSLQEDMLVTLRELYAAQGLQPELPVEVLPHTIVALGVGLSLQYLMDPGSFPPNLYGQVIRAILRGQPAAEEE